MSQIVPKEFSMKDLFIDVKLEACVGGSTYDFLGRKLFSTEFFRQGIGFGITSIDIEVNTSLQPLVTVVFKDLYGATIFGGQKGDASSGGQSIDYSVLFNWPPPKFLFSFKGFLGKPTSWVLNLKRTSTSFNSSDGSYELTCEFVPNQWGFFADLPFLYLLAAKTLRKDQIGENASAQAKKSITSVFDLIKIGKQVEVKTQDTTKEFDELVKQLGSLKSNVGRAVAVSSIVDFGEEINGVVNNRPVVNFQKMVFPKLGELDENINTKEKIEEKLGIATELTKLNTYLLLAVKFEYAGQLQDGFTKFGVAKDYSTLDVNDSTVSSAKNQTIAFINKNIDKIDDEIKRLVFASSESKLEKITIGEIFSQLAKDAAFVMGSILDAGLDGYRGDSGRQAARDNLSDILIGESFPLVINKDGEEVPATSENLDASDSQPTDSQQTNGSVSFTTSTGQQKGPFGSSIIGVDEHEMSFVRNFITAISEGIARDLPSDDATGAGQDDSELKQRVNNIEMTSNNPYKSNYTSLATNILVRGGIVGYMTRSNDPNLPGDYGQVFIDNDGKQQIEEIAVRDAENITDSMIKNLSDIDKLLLKRFYNFILKFYSSNGEDLIDKEGESLVPINNNNIFTVVNYPVVMSENPEQTLTFSQLWKELKTPSTLENVSLDENGQIEFGTVEFTNPNSTNEVFSEPIPQGIINAQNPLSFVDDATFTSTKIMNNGLVYCYPNPALTSGAYWAVVFRGNDNAKAQEANSSPTDGQYKNEDKDVDGIGQNEPLGYVAINSKYDEDNSILDRVESLEEYRDSSAQGGVSVVFDFDTLKDPSPSFYGAIENPPQGLEQFVWNNKIAADDIEAQQIGSSGVDDVDVAGDFGWTVCAHQTSGFDRDLVFGLFNSSHEGRSQRIFIRKMCETLKKNFEKIEDEQNQIIGSVLGKAGEQEDAIYKQMHTLFHQWQTLSYSDKRGGNGALCGDVDEHRGAEGSSAANTFGVARELEERFGSNHKDLINNDSVEVNGQLVKISGEVELGTEDGTNPTQTTADSNGVPNGTFIYDYPNQRIRGIPQGEKAVNVRDSIINLEPLYKANGNTSVLNIIQQICTKNNFLFIPIPGNPDYLNVNGIYSPSSKLANLEIKNFFHVLFTPTPESRTKTKNKDGTPLSLSNNQKNYNINSFAVKYGHPDNQIVKNIQVGTDDNKVTAESIINLQRIVDNENQNKKVTTDCSMLPVLAGRSYKATIDMLGNAQVYPMQFFFLENSPLFGGLYQIMKVNHSITPNDMSTSAEGIRMRFSPGGGYGAIKPVTLDTFRDLGDPSEPIPFTKTERQALTASSEAGDPTAVVVNEGDNVPVGGYTREKMEAVVKGKGYKWFDSNNDYELNIVGVRNTAVGSAVTNKFDDYITLSYKEGGKWKFWSWAATTQPGKTHVQNPSRADGVAIMKPGQYKDSHIIRKHAGKYEALGQNGSITVFRDNNKNLNYDLNNDTLQVSSNLGINIHHSSYTGKSWNVNKWSAGCQVFQDINDFNTFMSIARKARALHKNKFTYTLVESGDIA